MAQGRSTKIISMIKWIRTSRLSIKSSLSDREAMAARLQGLAYVYCIRIFNIAYVYSINTYITFRRAAMAQRLQGLSYVYFIRIVHQYVYYPPQGGDGGEAPGSGVQAPGRRARQPRPLPLLQG